MSDYVLDEYDRVMIGHAHQRARVHVRTAPGAWTWATLTGWHPADRTRGPGARVVFPNGQARTVRQADVVLDGAGS